ncbi:hypothetical protein DMN91_000347 [Ooceraea biroi]|uniref:C2H2-type domain-containing protein n=1 Tax=Ooceraea biroi TaxID=2015173 RepID=A0A3L8E1E4_OOCBI|nr:hypothetical protein DMN91_000347 [Ooceraea biroi]
MMTLRLFDSQGYSTVDAVPTCPYFCTDCRHTFAKKDDYVQHLESALHLSKIDNRDIPIRTVFTCKICSKSLVTQRALDQHVRRIHRGKKHFVCNVYEFFSIVDVNTGQVLTVEVANPELLTTTSLLINVKQIAVRC